MDLLSRNILFVFVCLPMGPIPTDREKCHEGTKGGGIDVLIGPFRWCAGHRGTLRTASPTWSTHRRIRKKPHPAIAAMPGALLNKGSRNLTSPTAERQRAGKVSTTTSLHPRRPNFHPASLPNGSPGSGAAGPVIFGYFPSLESTSPAGETLLSRPQAEHSPVPKTKLPWTFTIHGSFSI